MTNPVNRVSVAREKERKTGILSGVFETVWQYATGITIYPHFRAMAMSAPLHPGKWAVLHCPFLSRLAVPVFR